MKSHILRINSQATLLHRQHRKLVWLSLPELRPVFQFYTHSSFIHIGSDSDILIADKGLIVLATITLPPLSIIQYQREFLQCNPKGGFCLGNIIVLYQSHIITFYNKTPTLKQFYTIQVVQEINEVMATASANLLGVTVKERKNTIYIWDLSEFTNKPQQELFVSEQILKWEFYLNSMLIVMTKTHFRAYFHYKEQFCLQYYIELNIEPIDFCFLERPKSYDHTGRKSVYPIAILTNTSRIHIYELYDLEKRVKNSSCSMLASFYVSNRVRRIIYGEEKDGVEIMMVVEDDSYKPNVIVTDHKFVPIAKNKYLQDLGKDIGQIVYRRGVIAVQRQPQREQGWKVMSLTGRDQAKLITTVSGKLVTLGDRYLYTFEKQVLFIYTKESGYSEGTAIECKFGKSLHLLEQVDTHTFFISGIRILRLNLQQKTIESAGFVVRNQKFVLEQVRTTSRSLLYKVGEEYYLMEYRAIDNKVNITNIRSSRKKMISLRNGRWAELDLTTIQVGEFKRHLVTFDLARFFKSITRDNVLFDYQLYWTTHDGILLLVNNYLFVLQLVQSSEGYSLTPIKHMHTYLHHRFDPDSQIWTVLDSRELVVRSGNRVIQLGCKLGNYVSEDPLSLPDTLLKSQLDMKKHSPPHHPKIVSYLIQLGRFATIAKLMKKLSEWIAGMKTIYSLFEQLDYQFFSEEKDGEDQRIIVSATESEAEDANIYQQLCEKILQDPDKLQLPENGSLILESQIESLIFRHNNSRALDYYSSIVLTQFQSPINKNKAFETVHIAYMIHSINKEEAIGILKPKEVVVDWNWIERYSIVFWYHDHVQQLKQWVEEIGANLFRKNKQPFDCLLWYTLAGKKNLLTLLFKNNQFSSKEHAGVWNFLQKDFDVAKNREAAVKNAYALQDKKRYFHSIAFFILGQHIEQAVSLCLNRLRDVNLALLLCLLFDFDKSRLINLLLEEGDIWAKHIAYYINGKHIDSFNCLFEDANHQGDQEAVWNMQLKLSGFHPCVGPFAQMIEISIPVRRELQEQKASQVGNSSETDIFASFYGPESQTQSNKIAEVDEKFLAPNYEKLAIQSCKFFLQNNCPELALMIDKNNSKAKRAYDLSRYLLTKKISPTVLEIAEETEDILSILKSKLQNSESVTDLLQQHYRKYLAAVKKLQLNQLIKLDRYTIGKAIYFCHSFDEILQVLLQCQLYDENMQRIRGTMEISKLLICFQLNDYASVSLVIGEIMAIFRDKVGYRSSSHQFWISIKRVYDALALTKKDKTQNVLDCFEQTFYNYTFEKKRAQRKTYDFQLGVEDCRRVFVRRQIMMNVRQLIDSGNDLYGHLTQIVKRYGPLVEKWVQKKACKDLEGEIAIMYEQGAVSGMKINYLNDYLGDSFDDICKQLIELSSLAKGQQHSDNLDMFIRKQSYSKQQPLTRNDGVEVYRNRQENVVSFAINRNEGKGMQIVVLSKKNIRRVQICERLAMRNRTHEGYHLLDDEESASNIDQELQFRSNLPKGYPPVIEYSWRNVIQNRSEYDGTGILRGSAKRCNSDGIKSWDKITNIDIPEISTISCHHYLPMYLLGGKGIIDTCDSQTIQNFYRLKCPGMSDITKISSFQQRVMVLDSSGNLSGYGLQSKANGNCVYSMKKVVTDFCCFTPSIYGICTNNSIQVVDTLLHPKRQCVFKLAMTQRPFAIENYKGSKLMVARRQDIVMYDFRMDIQEDSRDIDGKGRSIATNHQNQILVGRQDGRVKVINLDDKSRDYQVKCLRNSDDKDKNAIQQIDLMGKIGLARSAEGSIYLINSL